MKNRTIQRLSGFCVLGLAVALNVTPIRAQNTPAQNPQSPQTPQTPSQQPGARSSGTTPSPATTGQLPPSTFVTRVMEMNSAEIQVSRLAATKAQNAQVKSYAEMLVKDHTAALDKFRKLQGSASASSTTPAGQSPASSTGNRTDTAGGQSTTPATGAPGTTGTPGAPGVPQTGQTGTAGGPRAGNQGATSTTQGSTSADRNLPPLNDEHQRLLTRLEGLSGSQFDRAYVDAMVEGHREAIRMFEQQAGTTSAATTSGATAPGAGTTRPGTTSTPGQTSTTGPTAGAQRGNPAGSAQREAQSDTRSTTSTTSSTPSATEVAALARELLPTLKQHLQQAEQIQKTLK